MPYKQIFNFYENDEHVLIFSAYTLYTSVYIFMHIQKFKMNLKKNI